MKREREQDDDRIDLNLDEAPIGPSPLDAAGVEGSLDAVLPASAEESPEAVQEALIAQLAKLQAEKDDLVQTLVRRQADFENYRKRIERDRHEDTRRATAIIVEGLLPVLDAFERALAGNSEGASEQYRLGFELIYKQLADALARLGLERIPAKGLPFDPFVHQAVERVETAGVPEDTVLEELQPGYRLKGSILRPSMVRVAVAPASEQAAGANPQVN